MVALMVGAPGATLLGSPTAYAQGEKEEKDEKPSSPTSLAQAAEKWEQAMLTDAAPLYEKALKEGGLFPSDVVMAYARIGTVQALLKQREAALSSFRVAAVIDPQFELPSESGKLAKELYEKARKDAAKQGGKLEISGEAPERVDASKSFQVTAKIADAFAPLVDKIGIEVKDTLSKKVAWKSDQPSNSSVSFDVPGRFVTGSTTLQVRVSALDQNGNRWASQEMKVKVREGKPVAGPTSSKDDPFADDEKKKSPPPKSFFATPWPYAIGGVLVAGGVVAYLLLRPPSQVTVGAPAWRLATMNQRPTAMTQSLSLNSYTGPDGNRVTGTYGTFFLGRYRVVDEIGVGGMASVNLARLDGAGGFQKWVAIKRIHPHLVEDDQFVHMFLDEARIAARISHANVAQVFELGEGDGNYWIAMEYLHGEPLREVMRCVEEGAPLMSYEVAAKIIADAAEGLHAAHDLRGKNGEALGLVHRDVTPHNLFVTYEGTVKVVDFGIAKVAGRLSSTRAGTLKGKLAYMSPEQVAGQEIDRRTDIFALGVVLWELTTNQRLFRTDSDLETLEKVQACAVPRPSQLRRDYPIQLEQIILKALAKDPAKRYQNARDLSRELQKFLLARGVLVGPENVSEYVHRIFGDRIRKRDEHLRWAAEVTQTINIDEFQKQQDLDVSEVSAVSYSSEVMPARSPRGPQALPAPGPAVRSIEAGLPLPSVPTGPLPPVSSLPAPRPSAASPASMRGTAKLPAITPPPPAPLPSFGAGRPASMAPPTHHSAYDDDDENIETVVGNRALINDDAMPTVAVAHQPGAMFNQHNIAPIIPAAGTPAYQPPPAAGAPAYQAPPPPPVPSASPYNHQYGPPPVNPAPQPPPVAYAQPPMVQSPYPAPQPPPPVAPHIAESPTFVPSAPPVPPSPAPMAVPLPTPSSTKRDPTLQVSLARQPRNMSLVILASVAGTLLVAGGGAMFALKINSKDPQQEPAKAASKDPTPAVSATSTATVAATTTVPPTVVVTAPATTTAPTAAATPTQTSTSIADLPPSGGTKTPSGSSGGSSTPGGKTTTTTPQPTAEKTAPPSGGSGFLTVVCKPACDSVTVKGRNLGPSPVVNVSFPAGTYPVTLKRSGAPTKSVSVTIVDGKNTPLRVDM